MAEVTHEITAKHYLELHHSELVALDDMLRSYTELRRALPPGVGVGVDTPTLTEREIIRAVQEARQKFSSMRLSETKINDYPAGDRNY